MPFNNFDPTHSLTHLKWELLSLPVSRLSHTVSELHPPVIFNLVLSFHSVPLSSALIKQPHLKCEEVSTQKKEFAAIFKGATQWGYVLQSLTGN